MIYPQVRLAQLAAILAPDYKATIVNAPGQNLDWPSIEAILQEDQPRYYITEVRASTLKSDMMRGVAGPPSRCNHHCLW